MPDTSSLVPSGILATPLKLIIVDALFWGVGACFAPSMMMDQYLPGVLGKAGKAQDMIWMILERIGFQSLLTTIHHDHDPRRGARRRGHQLPHHALLRLPQHVFPRLHLQGQRHQELHGWSFPLQATNFFQAMGITFTPLPSSARSASPSRRASRRESIRPPPSIQTRVPYKSEAAVAASA